MKVGIIGLGYWGPKLIRNFISNKSIESISVFDADRSRMEIAQRDYPTIKLSDSLENIFESDIEAVVIATPVHTHYEIARRALESGKHIWVEKPFTKTSKEAKGLIELAELMNLRIFVDHTFIYTGAVRKMKELIENDELGEIIYFDSERINLGLFQHDVNVIWDLAPHDLSIMDYLLPHQTVTSVSATGVSNYYELENVAQLSLMFKDPSFFAHYHVNWTSPVKIRRMIIGGKKKMLVFDDMENIEKLKVYDCGIKMDSKEMIHELLVEYRTGDMYSPKVNQTEALALGVKEFIEAIKEERSPATDGHDGLKVVQVLEAASLSIANHGQLVAINGEAPGYAHKKTAELESNNLRVI